MDSLILCLLGHEDVLQLLRALLPYQLELARLLVKLNPQPHFVQLGRVHARHNLHVR